MIRRCKFNIICNHKHEQHILEEVAMFRLCKFNITCNHNHEQYILEEVAMIDFVSLTLFVTITMNNTF